VAGGAAGHAATHEGLFGGQPEILGRGAGGDDEGIAGIDGACVAVQGKGALGKVDAGDVVVDELGVEPLGVRLEALHQIGPLHALGIGGPVVHVGGGHELAALFQTRDEGRLQVGARRIHGRAVPCRPRAENEYFDVLGCGHRRKSVERHPANYNESMARLPAAPSRSSRNVRNGPSPLQTRLSGLAREARWILFAALAAWLGLVLATWSPGDPAWSHSVHASSIANGGGMLGAYVSDLLLFLFGYSAWLWVVLLVQRVVVGFYRLTSVLLPDSKAETLPRVRWEVALGFALLFIGRMA